MTDADPGPVGEPMRFAIDASRPGTDSACLLPCVVEGVAAEAAELAVTQRMLLGPPPAQK